MFNRFVPPEKFFAGAKIFVGAEKLFVGTPSEPFLKREGRVEFGLGPALPEFFFHAARGRVGGLLPG